MPWPVCPGDGLGNVPRAFAPSLDAELRDICFEQIVPGIEASGRLRMVAAERPRAGDQQPLGR